MVWVSVVDSRLVSFPSMHDSYLRVGLVARVLEGGCKGASASVHVLLLTILISFLSHSSYRDDRALFFHVFSIIPPRSLVT